MKESQKRFLVVSVAVICLCLAFVLVRFTSDPSRRKPNFDGEITDVRVTAIPVDAKTSFWPDAEFIWVHYGYKKDGIWYDIPAENYEICRINSVSTAFDPLFKDHVVQIGPYVLIMLQNSPDNDVVISDSLGTEVQSPFEQYRDSSSGYVYMYTRDTERSSGIFSSSDKFMGQGSVSRYLIVPIAEIDSSYEITRFFTFFSEEKGEYTNTKIITGDEILEALGL